MNKVKVTTEYEGVKKEFECDMVIFGGFNVDHPTKGYPRIGMVGGIIGRGDMLSLHRAYVSLGKSIYDKNIEVAYGVPESEAIESVGDIMPEVTRVEEVANSDNS